VYGVPWLAGTRVLFYNKDLFAMAGLDPYRPPKDWKELLSAAKLINDPKKGVWGFSIITGEPESPWQEFLPFAWSNGANILSEDLQHCVLDSTETLEALEFYKELSRYSLIERQSQINELFAEGKIGVQISGSWNLRLIPKLNPGLKFGVSFVPKPQKENAQNIAFSGGELFVITKASRHPKEALELIKFLTNKENTMEIVRVQQNVVPAQKEALDDPYYREYPDQKVFLKQLETALGPPSHPRWTEMQEPITAMIEKTIMEGIPPKAAIKDASEKIEAMLKAREESGAINNKLITWFAVFIILITAALIYITMRGHKKSLLCLSPWLLTFLIFGLYPLIYSIVISFSRYDLLTSQFRLIGLKNYSSALFDIEFQKALWHTVVFCVGTVPFTVTLSLFCAILINRKIPFKQLYQAGLFLPVTTSVVVIATVFTYIYSPRGLANAVLDFLGIIHPQSSWLNSPGSWLDISIPLLSIMAMNIWASFGYYAILFLAGLQTIPENLYEVADLDGATEWQKFRYITFPQLKPIILLVIIINTIYSLQVFPEIFTMTMGGPLGLTTTAVYQIYNLGFHKFDMGQASSVAYILSAIIMLFSVFQMKLLKTDETLKE
jgi:multiple sugar transport system permease protein